MIDVLLLAPMPDEQEALLALLPEARRLDPTDDDNLVYYEAEVRASTGKRRYRVIVCQCDVGRPQSAGNATRAIERWRPRFLFVVGIAGGVRGEVQLGDLLVADQLVDYEQQKVEPAGVQPRDRVYPASIRLLTVAKNLPQQDWQSLLKLKHPSSGVSAVRHGPVATGDSVVGARDYLEPVRKRWPKLVGVEMEGAAVALAGVQSPHKPDFLMIRGVSDLADEQKNLDQDAGWRPYARQVAACYALALIRSGMIPPSRRRLVVGTAGLILAALVIVGVAYARHEMQIQSVSQSTLGRRALSPEIRASMVALLRTQPTRIGFASIGGDREAADFKQQLMDVFREAGWDVVDKETFMFLNQRRGVSISFSADPPAHTSLVEKAIGLSGSPVLFTRDPLGADTGGICVEVWYMP